MAYIAKKPSKAVKVTTSNDTKLVDNHTGSVIITVIKVMHYCVLYAGSVTEQTTEERDYCTCICNGVYNIYVISH